jgi:two-component system sensor histidine kinase DesK
MSWFERFGKYLALTGLSLMWPVIDTYAVGAIHGPEAVLFGIAGTAYVLTYGWFCLIGYAIRDPRLPMAVVATLTLLAVALDHLASQENTNYYLLPLMIAGFSLRPKPALVALAVVGAVAALELMLLARLPLAQLVLQAVLLVPGVALFGGSGMGLRYLVRTLAELRAARVQIAQHAADQERARIARDLHDLLGHNLSLITLKGELGTRLISEGAPGANELRDMVRLSRETLQQVREAVSGYRQPTLATELMAARVALQAAGIELEVKQNVGALDRESEAVLGWVIREATTNVIRHSGAKHCHITLTRQAEQIQIEIQNDGWRVPQGPAGNGLRGLEERLAVMGGALDAQALAAAGFRLLASIPIRQRVDAPALDVEVEA